MFHNGRSRSGFIGGRLSSEATGVVAAFMRAVQQQARSSRSALLSYKVGKEWLGKVILLFDVIYVLTFECHVFV